MSVSPSYTVECECIHKCSPSPSTDTATSVSHRHAAQHLDLACPVYEPQCLQSPQSGLVEKRGEERRKRQGSEERDRGAKRETGVERDRCDEYNG